MSVGFAEFEFAEFRLHSRGRSQTGHKYQTNPYQQCSDQEWSLRCAQHLFPPCLRRDFTPSCRANRNTVIKLKIVDSDSNLC